MIWQEFLANMSKQKPQPPAIYVLIQDSQIAEINKDCLKIIFSTEEARVAAKSKLGAIKIRIPSELQRDRLEFVTGVAPLSETIQPAARTITTKNPDNSSSRPISNQSPIINQRPVITQRPIIHQIQNPLTKLLVTPFEYDNRNNVELVQPVLQSAVEAEKTCQPIYDLLAKRTKQLAQSTLEIKFPWRVRVGGVRGFRDLLLPAFHPVYGIPYFPASSLKGVINAWARNNGYESEADELFGTLKKGMGKVQILDAFPTKPCLSMDMANPQWHWRGQQVEYKPEPHALLTLMEPEIVIGLSPTSRGTQNDIETVKKWLENALKIGIGSRVSAGYGRTEITHNLPHFQEYKFTLWSQGIYGANPPSGGNNWRGETEFRPVAFRGVLRYWFRVVALGLYSPESCQKLEQQLFGALGQEGSICLGMNWDKSGDNPLEITGKILLESKSPEHLTLAKNLLILASHLGGVGRGSRRPLHYNSGRLRGCHWELDGNLDKNILSLSKEPWQVFLQELINSFKIVHPSGNPSSCQPYNKGTRCQDVLNQNAVITLVPSPGLKHPRQVNSYQSQGNQPDVRGEALEILYGSDKFKGVNRDRRGNEKVGGSLAIPSYVLIKSNYPGADSEYQTVTIFGADFRDRTAFKDALPEDSIQVWPLSLPVAQSNASEKPSKPILKKRNN
ncbi:RAMP superfamily CRISPR-associated protein [Gloeomargarita lithophora]|nr:RAMP superfamily CRISPR-associated protein [Gloeomargarita lithophora]